MQCIQCRRRDAAFVVRSLRPDVRFAVPGTSSVSEEGALCSLCFLGFGVAVLDREASPVQAVAAGHAPCYGTLPASLDDAP